MFMLGFGESMRELFLEKCFLALQSLLKYWRRYVLCLSVEPLTLFRSNGRTDCMEQGLVAFGEMLKALLMLQSVESEGPSATKKLFTLEKNTVTPSNMKVVFF